jgi:hypothetical protein
MKLDELLQALNEYETGWTVGPSLGMGPDMSGQRGHGAKHNFDTQTQGGEWPYEDDDLMNYGFPSGPKGIDRGTPMGTDVSGGPPQPKLQSTWEGGPDSVEEAMGTPMNFTMSNRGGNMMGHTNPGASGGWANARLAVDDEDESLEESVWNTLKKGVAGGALAAGMMGNPAMAAEPNPAYPDPDLSSMKQDTELPDAWFKDVYYGEKHPSASDPNGELGLDIAPDDDQQQKMAQQTPFSPKHEAFGFDDEPQDDEESSMVDEPQDDEPEEPEQDFSEPEGFGGGDEPEEQPEQDEPEQPEGGEEQTGLEMDIDSVFAMFGDEEEEGPEQGSFSPTPPPAMSVANPEQDFFHDGTDDELEGMMGPDRPDMGPEMVDKASAWDVLSKVVKNMQTVNEGEVLPFDRSRVTPAQDLGAPADVKRLPTGTQRRSATSYLGRRAAIAKMDPSNAKQTLIGHALYFIQQNKPDVDMKIATQELNSYGVARMMVPIRIGMSMAVDPGDLVLVCQEESGPKALVLPHLQLIKIRQGEFEMLNSK